MSCEREEIQISGVEGSQSGATYYAECRDRMFRCNSVGRPMQEPLTICEPLDESPPPAEAGPPKKPRPTKWVEVALNGCAATAMFPEAPTRSAPPENIQGEVLGLLSDDYALSASCTRIDLEAPPEDVLERAIQGAAQNGHATVRTRTPIADRTGASVVLGLDDGMGQMLMRIWIKDGWMYLAVLAPRSGFTNEEVKKFFGGFKAPK